MPMVMRFFILALWCSAWPAQAETGKGTVEDPVTRDYTRGVIKDWQEGVVLHPETGNYIVTYKDSYGFFNSVIFDPATKIDPALKSKVNFATGGNSIAYEYKLKSRTESRQHIRALRTEITSLVAGSLVTPEGWRGAAATNNQSTGLPILLNWSHRVSGLAPGKSEKGFRLESLDLPGIATMRIEGDATRTTWLGNAPEVDTPAGIQMVEFRDFVPRLAAIPRISSPTPFNAAVVLGSIKNHIKEEMVSMQLLDPALLASIDRSLTQAIAAAQGGNTASLLYEIKNLRQLLKQEHADVDQEDDGDDNDKEKEPKPRIDKLAARVLDFDLKYVEKRVKGDKD
jgi:hypothetical protein